MKIKVYILAIISTSNARPIKGNNLSIIDYFFPPKTGMLPVNFGQSASFWADPRTPPPGALSVDQPCVPSQSHPRPVVLVHGILSNQATFANTIAPLLKNNGYCVYTFNYGVTEISTRKFGLGDVTESVRTLASNVQQVLKSTGTSKVDIVAHSEGGLVTSLYIRDIGGSDFVQNYIGLAPANAGSTANGLEDLATIVQKIGDKVGGECIACRQLLADSEFMQKVVKSSPLVVPGVSYTTIRTNYDYVVTPVSSQMLNGPNVKNILLQEECPSAVVGHTGIADDERALKLMLNALDPQNQIPIPC